MLQSSTLVSRSPRVVMVKVLDCGIVVSNFDLQSRYIYIYIYIYVCVCVCDYIKTISTCSCKIFMHSACKTATSGIVAILTGRTT